MEAAPEVTSMQLQPTHQFIMMGSDGVFDVLDDEEVVTTVQVSPHACCQMPSPVVAALKALYSRTHSMSLHSWQLNVVDNKLACPSVL